jgi:hypothetical protein
MPRSVLYYNMDATATIGIYAKKSGVWQKITSANVAVHGTSSTGGVETIPWTIDQSFQMGNNIQMFGAAVEDFNGYYNTACTITNISSVSWQAQGSTGTASATPNGEKSKLIVIPN